MPRGRPTPAAASAPPTIGQRVTFSTPPLNQAQPAKEAAAKDAAAKEAAAKDAAAKDAAAKDAAANAATADSGEAQAGTGRRAPTQSRVDAAASSGRRHTKATLAAVAVGVPYEANLTGPIVCPAGHPPRWRVLCSSAIEHVAELFF